MTAPLDPFLDGMAEIDRINAKLRELEAERQALLAALRAEGLSDAEIEAARARLRRECQHRMPDGEVRQ